MVLRRRRDGTEVIAAQPSTGYRQPTSSIDDLLLRRSDRSETDGPAKDEVLGRGGGAARRRSGPANGCASRRCEPNPRKAGRSVTRRFISTLSSTTSKTISLACQVRFPP